jgi:hypothetical protein
MYCVYLTVYRGNLLPPFYIGSTSIEKINDGYHGSVASIRYSKIWVSEIKNNKYLFKTNIISKHNTRQEALDKELFLQESLNVVHNELYSNLSLARKNGFFGRDVKGINNPMYGKDRSINHPKGMLGKKHSKETKDLFSKTRKGTRIGNNHPMFGKTWNEEQRKERSIKMTGIKRGSYKKKTA